MKHVLVVDDEPDQRQLLRMVLEDIGYTIEEAADGRCGLVCIRAQPLPCVVLLGRRMPIMSGTQVLAEMFQEPDLFHHHRIILMSADRRPVSHEMMQGITAHDVRMVDKSFQLAALETLIAILYQDIPQA